MRHLTIHTIQIIGHLRRLNMTQQEHVFLGVTQQDGTMHYLKQQGLVVTMLAEHSQ